VMYSKLIFWISNQDLIHLLERHTVSDSLKNILYSSQRKPVTTAKLHSSCYNTWSSAGSNAAAWWGYQFRAGFLDGDPREVITIYEVVEEDGDYYAVPDYQFRFSGGPTNYSGPTTACATLNGTLPEAAPGFGFEWSNPDENFQWQ